MERTWHLWLRNPDENDVIQFDKQKKLNFDYMKRMLKQTLRQMGKKDTYSDEQISKAFDQFKGQNQSV